MTDDVKVQDVVYFFAGSAAHRTSRRAMSDFAMKNYDAVCHHLCPREGMYLINIVT